MKTLKLQACKIEQIVEDGKIKYRLTHLINEHADELIFNHLITAAKYAARLKGLQDDRAINIFVDAVLEIWLANMED